MPSASSTRCSQLRRRGTGGTGQQRRFGISSINGSPRARQTSAPRPFAATAASSAATSTPRSVTAPSTGSRRKISTGSTWLCSNARASLPPASARCTRSSAARSVTPSSGDGSLRTPRPMRRPRDSAHLAFSHPTPPSSRSSSTRQSRSTPHSATFSTSPQRPEHAEGNSVPSDGVTSTFLPRAFQSLKPSSKYRAAWRRRTRRLMPVAPSLSTRKRFVALKPCIAQLSVPRD